MLSLTKPKSSHILHFLDVQSQLDFTYGGIGATATEPPAGYAIDRTRVKLGNGEPMFRAAKSALEHWQQFDLGWVEAGPVDTALREGEVVSVLARTFGLWWLNACRIVYVIDETDPLPRFGFAYGTLPGHAESGEERFLIEMDESADVWYDILAFSRPRQLLAWLGYPFARAAQARFRGDSAAAMHRAVESAALRSPAGNVR